MKNIKIFATFCICLLLFSACSDDWKENALTARFSFDKSLYYVGDEVRITNETVGGEGNYTYEWDLARNSSIFSILSITSPDTSRVFIS